MRVLVTGASGFLGRRLVAFLEGAGHQVIGLGGRDEATRRSARASAIDLCDPEGLRCAVEAAEPDAIAHLAGLSHVGESWKRPGDYFRVNFEGTRNLLRVAPGCRFLFASSAEVYGRVPEEDQPIREDRALDPRSPYAMTKACGESVARDAGAIVVRSFNVIGPGQAPRFALPSFARQLAAVAAGRREPRLDVGDLSPRRDFVHLEDSIDGWVTVLEKGVAGETYNLATGEAWSIAEVLDRLLALTGLDVRVVRDEARVRPVDLPLMCGDNSRLRALGWEPTRTLDSALESLWREVRGLA